MLGLNPSMRFYLCEGPVDMRKGIFTLAELVPKLFQAADHRIVRQLGDQEAVLRTDAAKVFVELQDDPHVPALVPG